LGSLFFHIVTASQTRKNVGWDLIEKLYLYSTFPTPNVALQRQV